jgi:hypothetical protein
MNVSDIEAHQFIEDLSSKRQADATSSRLKRSIQLVLGSFSPDHVLTELLQNADDVGATYAKIELTDDGLFLTHNGEEFNDSQVEALCDIGQTTKKAGVHIGFMGIGFKASFKVSDTPYVVSGPYRFHLSRDDVIVPYWLNEIPNEMTVRLGQGLTVIYLPFRQDLNKETLHSIEETAVEKLEPLSLVFLRNIERLSVISADARRELKKTKVTPSTRPPSGKARVTVEETRNGRRSLHDYLEFSKVLVIPESAKKDSRVRDSPREDLTETSATICFHVNHEVIEPIEVERAVLYTFLPTTFRPGLRFTINCDFLLNTQRSEPDFTSQWNLWLLASLDVFLREIVADLLHDPIQRLSCYDILPRKGEISEMFVGMRESLLGHLKDLPCVVTSDGGYAQHLDVALASAEIQGIIPSKIANARFYVHSNVRGRAFLRDELAVKDLTPTASEIAHVFMALQNKDWLESLDKVQILALYEFLNRKMLGQEDELWALSYQEHQELENKLKKLEIVKCTDQKFHSPREPILPFSEEKPNTELADLPLIFVDPALLSPVTLQLLKTLGVTDSSVESVSLLLLERGAAGKWKDWTEKQRIRTIQYIAKWLESSDYQLRESIEPKIGEVILPTETGEWATSSSCYVPDSELKLVLPKANYVNLSKLDSVQINTHSFLRAIGVLDFPRVCVSGGEKRQRDVATGIAKEKWEAYWRWLYEGGHVRFGTHPMNITIADGFLDGFDECVLSEDRTRLRVYFNFLIEHWEGYYKRYQEVSYHYFHYGQNRAETPSYFGYQLKTSKWLESAEGLRMPFETSAPLREIKRVGGILLPYLTLTEDQARKQKDLLDFLGVKTEINLSMLLKVLSRAKEVPLDKSVLELLGRVYQKLASICEDQDVKEDVQILDRKGNFVPSKTLHWADDPELESVVGEELPLAWVAENMSRPQMTSLFSALGVQNISSKVERSRIDNGQEQILEDHEATRLLRQRGDYVYSVLLHFEAGKTEDFPNFVRDVAVARAERVRLQLKVIDMIRELEVPCFVDKDERRIYRSPSCQYADVAREIARTFEAPAGAEFALNFVLTEPSETLLSQLKRSYIEPVKIPELAPGEVEQSPGTIEEKLEGLVSRVAESKAVESKRLTQDDGGPVFASEQLVMESSLHKPPAVLLDMDDREVQRQVDDLKKLMIGEKTPSLGAVNMWRESKEIDRVTSEARIVVSPFVGGSAEKDWVSRNIDEEKVFIESRLDAANVSLSGPDIRVFKEQMRRIVESMGGNPETVNICIANLETDGDRREGQLFFNVLRTDKFLRWIVVAARELAYTRYSKPSQAHISLMTDLIVMAVERLAKVIPAAK